jgi:hypothetical protein
MAGGIYGPLTALDQSLIDKFVDATMQASNGPWTMDFENSLRDRLARPQSLENMRNGKLPVLRP